MKTASNELIDALKNYSDIRFAELYAFTIVNGNIYRYTSLDVNVGSFLSSEILIRRGLIRQSIGLEVDDLEIEVTPSANANIGGIGWLQAIRNGSFDGAYLELQKAFFKWWSPDQIVGIVSSFTGVVSEIDPIGRASARIGVKSLVELLSVEWPRMTYESQCAWHLYGVGCRAVKNNFQVSGNVSSGGNTWTFPTDLAQANGYFDLGVIRFSSGNNLDAMRTIKAYSAGNVTVSYPLLNSPLANDSFIIYPGCDKTMNTCSNKFSNIDNFKGFPFIPSPETSY